MDIVQVGLGPLGQKIVRFALERGAIDIQRAAQHRHSKAWAQDYDGYSVRCILTSRKPSGFDAHEL